MSCTTDPAAPTSRRADRGSELPQTATCSVTCCRPCRCRMPVPGGAVFQSWSLRAGFLDRSSATSLAYTVNRFRRVRVVGGTPTSAVATAHTTVLHRSGRGPDSCLGAFGRRRSTHSRSCQETSAQGRDGTDPRARVLRPTAGDSRALFGGQCQCSRHGHSYAGAGSTIGPAMTFGLCSRQRYLMVPSDVGRPIGHHRGTIQSVSTP